MRNEFSISKGVPYPFGLSKTSKGINFALASQQAQTVSLCLFKRKTHQLIKEIPLSPPLNKTGHVWHVEVQGVDEHFVYAYRVTPAFDNTQDLISDPYAKALATHPDWGNEANRPYIPYGEIFTADDFDWEEDSPPNLVREELVIYEMHVRGFTQHFSSNVAHPGKFLGLIDKIPYLQQLGVNAIELLPIHEFNEQEYALSHPATTLPLYNFWGYSTVNYFAPMNRYASSEEYASAVTDFKTMVKALHRHGIEVILDVVFNHTAEGDETGPVLSYKALDNALYYMLDSKSKYRNFTGCGNTVNANQPSVQELIIHSLRYWVSEMHVDGFRFDLASDLSRDTKGVPQVMTSIIRAITEDPILAKTKLIAEPWDAAGLYQVGQFAAKSARWSEWNDKYRDCIRRFIKGTSNTIGEFASRISGSQDLYYDRGPGTSLNFITAHDGFSLADLVSFDMKYNMANGENNLDGSNHNESWNCGVEGPTTNPEISKLRQRQMRNFHLALMLSQGIPMLVMGDEYGHTKNGNNNTFCQDNELSWFLWDMLEKNQEFFRFYTTLIHFRKQHAILRRDKFYDKQDIDWHGKIPFKPEWDKDLSLLGFTIKDQQNKNDLYAAFNPQNKQVEVTLPSPPQDRHWYWVVDTANESPRDIFEDKLPLMAENKHMMLPYSAILLKASE